MLDGYEMHDLTQPWCGDTPAWPTYDNPKVWYEKSLDTEKVNGQKIEFMNHTGTHLDGEKHFIGHGRDIESMPLDELVGDAVIADISDKVGDYDVFTSEMIEDVVDVREGDILYIHTGYQKYAWHTDHADPHKFFIKHPGPNQEFADWCREKGLNYLIVDCGSADHPMNTVVRDVRPDAAAEAREALGVDDLDEIFPEEGYQLMHTELFPEGIIHVENAICPEELLNERVQIGTFPWRFRGGESSVCRCVAFTEE
ncbi:cyclase family protein [halophilic archaeon DL31]|jgi:kynurenine formamidase|nr:cyclase family protein [halophilic archaeon DL31]